MKINYIVTHPKLTPLKALPNDAGYDLKSAVNLVLNPCQRVLVSTGLSLELPSNSVGMVCSKSGLALKFGVSVLNSPGIIDSSYRGEIRVVLYNAGTEAYKIEQYSKVAQLIILEYSQSPLSLVTELSQTERGCRGFGSTGLK